MSLALIQDSSLKSMALIFSRVGRAENFSYPIQSMPMCDKNPPPEKEAEQTS